MNWLFLGKDQAYISNLRHRRDKRKKFETSMKSLEDSITLTHDLEKKYSESESINPNLFSGEFKMDTKID